jgi:hypothetical protein
MKQGEKKNIMQDIKINCRTVRLNACGNWNLRRLMNSNARYEVFHLRRCQLYTSKQQQRSDIDGTKSGIPKKIFRSSTFSTKNPTGTSIG